MARARRESRYGADIWPGFVDALSTLLLAIIFLLVVFVLAQFFMSQMLEGRDEAVIRLEQRVRELSTTLERERDLTSELRHGVQRLAQDLRLVEADRDELGTQLRASDAGRAVLDDRLRELTNERTTLARRLDELRQERQRFEQQAAAQTRELERLRADRQAAEQQVVNLQSAVDQLRAGQQSELIRLSGDIDTLRQTRDQLERQVAGLASERDRSLAELQRVQTELQWVRVELASERERGQLLVSRLNEAEEQQAQTQRDVAARQSRIDDLLRTVGELEAARQQEAAARAEAVGNARELTRQIEALRQQLVALDRTLTGQQSELASKDAQISDLGQRLNLALASKVEELSQYRSDFFGRLRRVLGEREDVRIVGDRFVLQSEVLFGSAEADIGPGGQIELAKLAQSLKQIASDLPTEQPWVLQVDGHTDRRPINTPRFPSNWELSAARAISVTRFLVAQGFPPDRLAARGFAEFQPLDISETEEARRRNRRIELKFTTR